MEKDATMLRAYFERLYRYNDWANVSLLELLGQQAELPEPVMKFMSHSVAACEIWIARIEGRTPRIGGVWELYDLARCMEISGTAHADWLSVIPTLTEEGFYRKIAYKNTQGNYYETPVIDIMGHCVNHNTYHRAQIAVWLRQAGITPINTDFITYARAVALEV